MALVVFLAQVVGILKLVEAAAADGVAGAGHREQAAVKTAKLFLLGAEFSPVEFALVQPLLVLGHAPIVEDGGAAVFAAEALGAIGGLAHFLARVEHYRAAAQGGRHGHGRDGAARVGGKFLGGNALLVVVFQEAQHVRREAVALFFPDLGDVLGGAFLAHQPAYAIVEAHLIVEKIEFSLVQVGFVFLRIIGFADENQVGFHLFELGNHVGPELDGHHFHHVAAEAIHVFAGPEHKDVAHLLPSVGHGFKVLFAAVGVVHAVVQLHGFKPIVDAGGFRKNVVAGGFGGRFGVLAVFARAFQWAQRVVGGGHHEAFAGQVVEVVVGREGLGFVVGRAQIHHALRLGVRLVGAGHVVGNEVHNHLQAVVVGALDEGFVLRHAVLHYHGQVGGHVVVVLNGVGRAGPALHHVGIIGRNTLGGVVRHGSVLNHAGVPYVAHPQLLDFFESGVGDVVELAAAIFADGSVRLVKGHFVAKQARHQLVDDDFVVLGHLGGGIGVGRRGVFFSHRRFGQRESSQSDEAASQQQFFHGAAR